MKKICVLLLLAASLTGATRASQTDSSALTTLKQSNDRLVHFSLNNGMNCLLKEDHSAPVVSIQIWVGSGSIHEGEWLGAGLSHYVEHMVFKGTPTQKPGEIAKTIIGLGGKLNAYTSLDRTVFHTDLPSRNWKDALATLSDAVINASFPESEWGREKDVILREFSMGEDDPDREIQKLLFETAYTTHPYRIPIIGLRDIFKSITREDLLGFYHRRYIPDNMVAVVVGDIQPDDARQALTAAFSRFARRANPPVFIPAEPPQTSPRQIRKAGAYNVSRLEMAFHTATLSDPDAPSLDLLAAIMGGGQSSRLVQDIKETRKLVHGISASSFTPLYPGLFSISATLDAARESAVIDALQKTVASWATLSFSKNEIEKAKRLMLVNELSGLQTMHGQAASMAEGQLFMRDPRYSESYLARLQAVTAADLQAVALKYFRPENRVTVILGPDLGAASGVLPSAMSQPSEVIKRTLPHGVPLILREDHRLPFIYVCAAFLGGVISENEKTSGISQLMSDLLIRGTPRRSAVKIAQTVETLGAELSPFAGYNSVGLRGRSLAGDADTLLDVMFDCLGNAAFPTNEVEKQKVIQLAAISAEQEEPMNIARDALNAALFAGHPYHLTLLGTPRSVAGLDQAGLRDYYRRQLVTGNLVIALFGDITAKAAEALVSRYIDRIRQDVAPARLGAIPSPMLPTRLEKREPREQCIVLYGFPGVSLSDSRRDPLDLLEAATSGMSSRLFETVREKRGLAYYASTNQRFGLDSGIFTLFAGTRIDALPEVETLIREEIERVTTKGLEPEEVARARNMIIAEHEMRLQDNGTLAMMCALDELYGQGFAREFSTRKRIEAVTPEQIKQAAVSILTTNKLAISVVLPESTKPGAQPAN